MKQSLVKQQKAFFPTWLDNAIQALFLMGKWIHMFLPSLSIGLLLQDQKFAPFKNRSIFCIQEKTKIKQLSPFENLTCLSILLNLLLALCKTIHFFYILLLELKEKLCCIKLKMYRFYSKITTVNHFSTSLWLCSFQISCFRGKEVTSGNQKWCFIFQFLP